MKNDSSHKPESLDAIAERLIRLRLALGYSTQASFIRYYELSQTAWNNYERATSRMRIDEAIKLVQQIGVTLDWIYLGDDRWMPHDLMQKINNARESA